MKRRILSVLMALALCVGLFPTWAWASAAENDAYSYERQYTSVLNLSVAESSDKLSDEGWKWDVLGSDSYKLTLQNFSLKYANTDKDSPQVIILPKGTEVSHPSVEIELRGTNVIDIDNTNNASGPLISATHSDITVCGDGSLQITANEPQPKAYVFGSNALTIQSGTVSSNIGLGHLTEDFAVNGGTLNIDTRTPSGTAVSDTNNGIYTLNGNVNISNGNVNIQSGNVGLETTCGSITISGGTVSVSGVLEAFYAGNGVHISSDIALTSNSNMPTIFEVDGGIVIESANVTAQNESGQWAILSRNADIQLINSKIVSPGNGAVGKSSGGYSLIMAGDTAASNVTIKRTHTIAFDSTGGSAVGSQLLADGEAVVQPSAPVRDGYTFAGWYQEASCQTEWDFENGRVSNNMTLFAKWEPIPVTGVALSQTELTIEEGKSGQLNAIFSPDVPANRNVTWTSSNESIATVDSSGKITAVEIGTVEITVTTEEGHFTAVCTVTVKAASDEAGSYIPPVIGDYTPSDPGDPAAPTQPVTTTGQSSSEVTTTTTAAPSSSASDGTASAAVDASMGDEIVRQAVDNNSETVVIAPQVTGDVAKTEVSIPAATVGQIGSQTSASLTVSTPVAEVSIPNGGLGSLASAGGTVTVAAEKTGNTVELSVTAGGKAVTSVPGGLTLTVPANNTTPGTVAVLLREDGTREVVRKSVAAGGGVTVPLDGSARLEIVDNSKQFADVPAGSWAADAVAFASAHELFGGASPDRFDPDKPMSRGMLAVVLHNLEGNPFQAVTNEFADVEGGAWYAQGVAWAAARSVIGGYGNGRFGPNDNITREQLAVILWRYAGSPAAMDQALDFTDVNSVSDWALDALRWTVENGILSGKGGGVLDPQGYATRAETAQILKNFMERQ